MSYVRKHTSFSLPFAVPKTSRFSVFIARKRWPYGEQMGTYRLAEICPNGHVVTASADQYPEHREKFCSKCGEETLTQCPYCKSTIRGQYESSRFGGSFGYTRPAHCHNCGSPFPWTGRKLDGVIEYLQAGADLTTEEIQQLRTDLTDLTKDDSPKTQVASLRFKKVMAKVGTSVATGVREIIVDVLSEAAKKAIWGD